MGVDGEKIEDLLSNENNLVSEYDEDDNEDDTSNEDGDDNDDHDDDSDVADGDNVGVVDVNDDHSDVIDDDDDIGDVDEKMDMDGVIIEYEEVAGSYWELYVSCSLDELLSVDDTKVLVEDTSRDVCKVSSYVKLVE